MSIHSDAEEIRKQLEQDEKTMVSVALFGQPGAGKSSLINAIVGEKVAEVGVETDKTVEAAEYVHKGLKLVDLPGYGTKSFPKDEYFQRFGIQNLDLFLCVTSGKLLDADTQLFQELAHRGKACIFVVNRHDELWEEGVDKKELEARKVHDIHKHVGKPVKVIFTSCRQKTGLDLLEKEIMVNLAPAKQERWVRSAKAYSLELLAKKRAACEKHVTLAAGLSAANALNPIPGADIAVDVGILVKLFQDIRETYGLSDEFLGSLKLSSIGVVARLANNVAKYAVREGIMLLLKNMVGRVATKSVTKYIPFVGQAIAAGIGYKITSSVGEDYLNDCHQLAEEILKNNLRP